MADNLFYISHLTFGHSLLPEPQTLSDLTSILCICTPGKNIDTPGKVIL